MSNVRTWFAGCSLWLLLTATTLAQSHPLTPILPTPSQLSRYQLVRQWWGTALINPDRDKVTFLTLDDTQLYVQTTSGGITCFDAETGRRIWATRVGTPDAPQYPIVISEDLVVVVTGSSIITLGRSTGDQIWELELPGAPGASPTVDEEALYVPMLNGNLMAFDLKSLTDSSNKGLLPQWSYRSIRWKYATSKPLAVSPVVGAPFITFASLSGTMYTVDRRDRTLKYTFDTSEPVTADIISQAGRLYVPSGDSRIYAINQASGQILWQFVVGSQIRLTPHLLENDLFVSPDRSGMICLSADQGEFKWRNMRAETYVSGTPTTLFASDRIKNLMAIDRTSGETRYVLPFDRYSVRLANELTDRIYIATPTGVILCLRERDRPQPIYYRYPERRPILPEFAPEEGPASDATAEEAPATTE